MRISLTPIRVLMGLGILYLLMGPRVALSNEATREDLEARNHQLEQRLITLEDGNRQLEQRLLSLEQQVRTSARTTSGRARSAPEGKIEPTTPARDAATANDAKAQDGAGGQSANAALPNAKQETRSEVPQEFNVFRDQAATLKKNKFDVSWSTSYVRQSTTFTKDRVAMGRADIRYGILDGWEVGITVPAYLAQRENLQFGGGSNTTQVQSLGDIALQTNYLALKESGDWPGVVLLAGMNFPTGKSPFVFGSTYLTGNVPLDPQANFLSRGLWQFGGGFQLFKTLDPILVFGGLRVDKPLRHEIGGYTVEAGRRFQYNAGFSFALNEKVTLGFAASGVYDSGIYVNGAWINGTTQEQHVARTIMVVRVGKDAYLEPSVAFGLTPDSPNVELTLTSRVRF